MSLEELSHCNICKKNFKKSYFEMHLKEHSNACGICGYSLRNKRSIIRHIKDKHDLERPFKCTEKSCNSSFTRNENLIKHVLIKHKNFEFFKCDKCNKKFQTKNNLRRHLKKVCTGKFQLQKLNRIFINYMYIIFRMKSNQSFRKKKKKKLLCLQ